MIVKSSRACGGLLGSDYCCHRALMPMPISIIPARLTGSVLAAAPKEVAIWFTEALEPKFSTIEVRDAAGAAMQAGPATLAADNTALLQVTLKPLPPGTYKVMWRVLSVDTHRTQGEFDFKVGP